MTRLRFRIPIGDWSGDGHGYCNWFIASTPKTIKDVREAYFAAQKLHQKQFHPESFCEDYEDDTVSIEYAASIKELSGVELGEPYDDEVMVTPEAMAEYLVWFINQGDPSVDVQLEESVDETLHFSGYDKKKRHIGFIGYGLFN